MTWRPPYLKRNTLITMVTLKQEQCYLVGGTDSIVKVSHNVLFFRSYFNGLLCLTIKIHWSSLNTFYLMEQIVSFNEFYTITLIFKWRFGKMLFGHCTPTPSSFFGCLQRHATWLHGIGFSFNMAAKKCLNSQVSKSSCDLGFNAQFVTRWM